MAKAKSTLAFKFKQNKIKMSDKRKVLVFGATGQQGGGVVKVLKAAGHDIIALTRNPDSDKAQALKASGVDVSKGDFHSTDDLVNIMKEVDTVFSLTTPFEEGVERETAQGVATAEAAKKAGVGHFIFSSVASADKATGIPHFDSKYEVEKRIKELELPYTIIAPVYFMNNLVLPWTTDALKTGKISMAMPADRMLQQIASGDIAKFVGAVVDGREKYFGSRIDIAGDELTGEQMAQQLARITGKQFAFDSFSPDAMRETMEDMAIMFEWFDRVGYSADIEGLRTEFPNINLTSFEDYARLQDWEFLG
jgi:uncharacterized protein YbjT (DUF2867 family)